MISLHGLRCVNCDYSVKLVSDRTAPRLLSIPINELVCPSCSDNCIKYVLHDFDSNISMDCKDAIVAFLGLQNKPTPECINHILDTSTVEGIRADTEDTENGFIIKSLIVGDYELVFGISGFGPTVIRVKKEKDNG